MTQIKPSIRLKPLVVLANTHITIATPIITNISIIDSDANDSGEITADIPKINKMLKIFEPIALPKAKPGSFLIVATTEVTSSGNDVPIATIVKPIKF